MVDRCVTIACMTTQVCVCGGQCECMSVGEEVLVLKGSVLLCISTPNAFVFKCDNSRCPTALAPLLRVRAGAEPLTTSRPAAGTGSAGHRQVGYPYQVQAGSAPGAAPPRSSPG